MTRPPRNGAKISQFSQLIYIWIFDFENAAFTMVIVGAKLAVSTSDLLDYKASDNTNSHDALLSKQ
jgi:hypothetical protein